MIAHSAELLTPEEVQRVHDASLEILEGVGLLVRNPQAREILTRHGCTGQAGEEVIRFPRRVVEEHRASIPPTFTFGARDPQYDRTLPGDAPVIVTGSSAPNLVDPTNGRERRARSDDIARIAHLVQNLPAYDVFSIPTLADDAPAGLFTLSRLYPAMKFCSKPIRVSGPPEDTLRITEFAYFVAGGEDAYREHPFLTHHYCPVVSPLTMDFDSTGMLIHFTEQGLPCYATLVPNGGLTSPLTLTGTLVQGNAEFLAAAVLEQMVRPGKSTLYSSLPTIADMRTGAYSPGAIETGILFIGVGQMARFYGVPCGGYIGLSNAKVNDAQSGFETALSTLAGVLGDVHMLNMAGLLDALMAFDFGKAVIDDEIAQMLKKVKRGLEFSEENLALDVITEVGPGGMFADNQHTLERMKTAALLPEIADRDPRAAWEEKGALDSQARALHRAREILTRDAPGFFSAELDAEIHKRYPGIVGGEYAPPPGWVAEAPARGRPDRAERHRRRAEAAEG
ncbi:MAG: trimethylamine methyltransferase family protein [Anaerolineales bacterium]